MWEAAAVEWAAIQELTCAPVYLEAFARAGLAADTRYLDVGCGSGLALEIAAAKGARVSGIDAASELLAIAQQRVPSADLRLGAIESLPFPDASFDLVTGFNAFQYAASPAAALAEAKRVTRPGAAVIAMVWGQPEGMPAASVVTALRPLLPSPPPGTPGPFALSDETALRSLAESVQLEPVAVFDVASPWRYPDLPTAIRGLGASGVAVHAAEIAGSAAVDEAHRNALTSFQRPDGTIEVGACFRCLLARV